ncbi:S-formylglutathione hydrolase FrmB [Flavobacterium succinicans]|uniref:S-formylglutathione hydrolase FrmB n=1 Tax=Flavobacterium succinicans TaxID=29536 RepID=A0A1I4U5S9_9FLAO|nr:alpha/beta hydrolase-fold protein [Flavobacterium succinicans]SFM84358.1 S-formylglutathione hydrolase FrmB [Flavobacterium succinicans]
MNRFKIFVLLFFFLMTIPVFSAKVDTIMVNSIAMNKNFKTAVVLPNSYAKSKISYPVLYLLHGAYGHFSDWLKNTPSKNLVKNLADQYDLIIVMPEGEKYSFYLDSPINKGSQFETFITKEVIGAVDASYRTITDKRARAITGLSMGGHGALYLSAKHPELFCAAGSMSGAVDMSVMLDRQSSAQVIELMQPVFGEESNNRKLYEKHAVLRMIDAIKANQIPLIMDCGVDDFLIESNRELHRQLVYNKVAHDYIERAGAHTWVYWENALPYHLLFFSKIMSRK